METTTDELKMDYEFVSSISLPALVKLLAEKGFIKPEELLKYELEYKNYRETNHHSNHANARPLYSHSSWLKRWASKRRWSRRFTAIFLGWEWKKVKVRISESDEEE